MDYIQYHTDNVIITKNSYLICGHISSIELTDLMRKYPITKLLGTPKTHILRGGHIKVESEINLGDVLIYQDSKGV